MTEKNGEKSKLIYWLLSVIQIFIVSFLWWLGSNAVEAKTDIATLKANYASIDKSLQDIKGLLTQRGRQ